MSEFVEECRREWRRLGVADPLADEMAADLASDLEEAEADGVTAAEYLGRSASDPRSFAVAWATERGVIPAPSRNRRRAPRALVAFTVLAAVALVVAAVLLATGEPKVSITTRMTSRLLTPPVARPVPGRTVRHAQASAAAPVEWILLVVAVAALGFAAWLWLRWRRSQAPIAAPGSRPPS